MINEKGFTLGELLMVVVILGVMGGVALPKFYPQKEKGVVAEAVAVLGAIRQGEIAWSLENGGGDFTGLVAGGDWTVIGMADPNVAGGRFTYSVDAGNNLAIATRVANGVNAAYAYRTLNLGLADGNWKAAVNPAIVHPFQPTNAN